MAGINYWAIGTQNILSHYWWVLWLLFLWVIPWKGVALWKAARRAEKVWFVVLLVVNTIGILEILYIFFFSKKAKPTL